MSRVILVNAGHVCRAVLSQDEVTDAVEVRSLDGKVAPFVGIADVINP